MSLLVLAVLLVLFFDKIINFKISMLFSFKVTRIACPCNYNCGQKSLGHLCNVMNYLCFTSEVSKKRCYSFKSVLPSPLPTQYNVENQVKLQALVFTIVCGVEGEVR